MDSQWLKMQFVNNPDKSKADLAKELGLEPPAISKILSNARQIKAKEYAIMRRFFGLPVDETQFVAHSTSNLKTNRNSSNPAFEDRMASDGQWKIPKQVLQKRLNMPTGSIRIFEVTEHLMEPEFNKGEHIAVDTSDHNIHHPGAFMISDGYCMMIRHCAINPKTDDEIKVSAASGDFQDQTLPKDFIKVIGRVIAKMHWV